ncbi:MAG: flavodoxin family protein, partial [Fibrobacter sp.]|nr:flavodoxin family protein [Fibrobacter sp.]
MKILIIDSGLKPGWTKKTADSISEILSSEMPWQIERITLRDEEIRPCRGCAVCLERGEQRCGNYNDSTAKILSKMEWADGIITVTPNYSLQVPWILKNLYDRMAFIFHRPRLFHKISMAVVVQGVFGGGKIIKYINELMTFWGCTCIKGAVVTGGLYPNTKLSESILEKNDKALKLAVQRFCRSVSEIRPRHPSLFRLMLFRMTRTAMKYSPDALVADKAYYSEKG